MMLRQRKVENARTKERNKYRENGNISAEKDISSKPSPKLIFFVFKVLFRSVHIRHICHQKRSLDFPLSLNLHHPAPRTPRDNLLCERCLGNPIRQTQLPACPNTYKPAISLFSSYTHPTSKLRTSFHFSSVLQHFYHRVPLHHTQTSNSFDIFSNNLNISQAQHQQQI